MAFFKINGAVTHAQIDGPGDAPAIVLAHSLGTDLGIWDAQARVLARRYRVVRYDLRGHGLSEADGEDGSIDALAGHARGLMDTLGVNRAVVVGASIGGLIAQRLATLAADRISALVLCGTALAIGTPAMWDQRIAAVRQAGALDPIVENVLERWFTTGFRASDTARGAATMLRRTSLAGYIAGCAALRDADLTANARAIACPTLVAVGAEDGVTTPAHAKALSEAIAGAKLAVLPNAAHIPSLERPEELAALIEIFLARALS